MRVGLVGLGRVVERYHLPALARSPDWVLVAGCDPSPDRRRAFQTRVRGLAIESSLEAMLQRSELNAVLIASPPSSHARQAAQTLAAGLGVLVEKPLAANTEEAKELLRILEVTGGILRVGLNRRFLPAYRQLRGAVRKGILSKEEMLLFFSFPMDDWGAYSRSPGGLSERGDVLEDVGSHMVDLVMWIRGCAIVEARGVHSVDPERTERFELRLIDGHQARCEASHAPAYREDVRVFGMNETWQVESWNFAQLGSGVSSRSDRARLGAWLGRKTRRVLGLPDPMLQSFVSEWEDFAAACRGTVRPDGGATVEDGWSTIRVLEAIQQSQMNGGKWVGVQTAAGPRRGSTDEIAVPVPQHVARQAAEDNRGIDVSIILVIGNQRERSGRTLKALLSQDGLDRAEIILLDAGTEAAEPLPGSDHPAVRLFGQDRNVSFGEMRARGARMARGQWLAFIEEHCLPLSGWLAAAFSVFDGPWAAIGGEMHSANPGIGVSDATAMMNYGNWRPPAPRGESRLLPGHNVFYRRDILLQYDSRLGEMLQAEAVLHMRMTEAGYRLRVEPSIRYGHLNETSLGLICRSYWHWHRSFAGVRARDGSWGWDRRLARVLATPLVPWVRGFRMLRSSLTDRPKDLAVFVRFLPTILITLSCASLGLAAGYLLGTGSAPAEFVRCELDVERKTEARAPG